LGLQCGIERIACWHVCYRSGQLVLQNEPELFFEEDVAGSIFVYVIFRRERPLSPHSKIFEWPLTPVHARLRVVMKFHESANYLKQSWTINIHV
jgi:hypothetical protein